MLAETNFRELLSRWNQQLGVPPEAATGEGVGGWFSTLFTEASNQLYMRLPTYNSEQIEEPLWFQLSRFERLLGFILCFGGSVFCFAIGIILFPVLALNPRKFAMLWLMGSLLFVVLFGMFNGPVHYFKHLILRERIFFSAIFFLSVLATLFCLVVLKLTLLTVAFGVVEVFAVLYYTMSYFPFGAQTFQWFVSTLIGWTGLSL